mmetsp:Transcript_15094/g.56916  ORF Transcript_15094/g.56916 Transcript_15094/m.56916 type:complete len:645 (+) Transcript_15094:64-1998(+)
MQHEDTMLAAGHGTCRGRSPHRERRERGLVLIQEHFDRARVAAASQVAHGRRHRGRAPPRDEVRVLDCHERGEEEGVAARAHHVPHERNRPGLHIGDGSADHSRHALRDLAEGEQLRASQGVGLAKVVRQRARALRVVEAQPRNHLANVRAVNKVDAPVPRRHVQLRVLADIRQVDPRAREVLHEPCGADCRVRHARVACRCRCLCGGIGLARFVRLGRSRRRRRRGVAARCGLAHGCCGGRRGAILVAEGRDCGVMDAQVFALPQRQCCGRRVRVRHGNHLLDGPAVAGARCNELLLGGVVGQRGHAVRVHHRHHDHVAHARLPAGVEEAGDGLAEHRVEQNEHALHLLQRLPIGGGIQHVQSLALNALHSVGEDGRAWVAHGGPERERQRASRAPARQRQGDHLLQHSGACHSGAPGNQHNALQRRHWCLFSQRSCAQTQWPSGNCHGLHAWRRGICDTAAVAACKTSHGGSPQCPWPRFLCCTPLQAPRPAAAAAAPPDRRPEQRGRRSAHPPRRPPGRVPGARLPPPRTQPRQRLLATKRSTTRWPRNPGPTSPLPSQPPTSRPRHRPSTTRRRRRSLRRGRPWHRPRRRAAVSCAAAAPTSPTALAPRPRFRAPPWLSLPRASATRGDEPGWRRPCAAR